MGERHSTDRRFSDPSDPYNPDEDYGSYEAANTRERARGPETWELDRALNPAHPYGMVSSPLPCRLCEPGYVCHFHRD